MICLMSLWYKVSCHYLILCKVLVKSLKEDWGEHPRSWTHIIFTITRPTNQLNLGIPTLILHLHQGSKHNQVYRESASAY